MSSFKIWNSRQDFLNWVRSEAFLKGHAQSGTLPKEAFVKSNVLEMHEVGPRFQSS
jgi:heme-degrading monooxygenase HmoA